MRAMPILRCFLVLLLISVSGCHLGHEQETIVMAFPPGRDEVRVLLIYQGFHVISGNNRNLESVLQSAKHDLGGLMASEQEFRLGGWPLHFNLAPQKGETEEQKEFREFLRAHLTIRKGAFFSDPDGRLNGYQFLTIRDGQKFVARINDRVSTFFAKSLSEGKAKPERPEDDIDEESLELILKAAREKHRWLDLKPGRISFTIPGTQTLFERGKREVLQLRTLENLRKEVAKVEEANATAETKALRKSIDHIERDAEWLSQLPLSFDLRKDRMTLSLGFGEGEPIIVKTPNESQEKRLFEKELIAHARTLGVPFQEEITSESLIAEFLKDIGPTSKETFLGLNWHTAFLLVAVLGLSLLLLIVVRRTVLRKRQLP
jgi:hypothetical protein